MVPRTHPSTQSPNAKTPVYLPGTDRPVGFVGGGVFSKQIQGSKHLLRRPAALAFDVATLDAAERAGAVLVAVTDAETGKVYRQRIETIRRYGFPVTRGFGRQIALELDAYAIDGRSPVRPPGTPATNEERKALQPALFGGAA